MDLGPRVTKKGFTLVELSFAIAFISVLLITVTLITNEIVSIYRKGYSIKAVNQVGRDLIEDFQNSITQSPPSSTAAFCGAKYSGNSDEESLSACESNNGFYSIYQQYYTNVKVAGSDDENGRQVPTSGLFCSGKYTYIWNTGYLFNKEGAYEFTEGSDTQEKRQDSHKLKVSYTLSTDTTKKTIENFRLLKVEDTSRTICASTLLTDTGYPTTSTVLTSPGGTGNMEIDIPFQLSEAPEELITESDSSLALFDLVVFQPARVTSTNRLLFSGSFILATVTGGVDIMATGDYCKAPSYFDADFSYCAINKFNFTIQASGG